MQSNDDAALDYLDSLESLVIFDRICPFAIEHLPPAMSRRVFDVGLDMGRIRNGLHSRKDGRTTRSFRFSRHKGSRDVSTDGRQSPDGHLAMVKHQQASPDLEPYSEYQQPADASEQPNSDAPLPPSDQTKPEDQMDDHDSIEEPPNHDLVRRPSENALNFDLKPPPPNTKVKQIDTLAERLFSGEHLRVILNDPSFFLRFTAFLNRYKPQAAPTLVSYLEAQKALKAIEYANALAASIKSPFGGKESSPPLTAASVDPHFESSFESSFESLVEETLPAYVTHALTKVVTECMVREITGQSMPMMRELVSGLAEVFCLADPSVQDCPIVYASEEFYHTTRYSRDDVLGRNCRFLQGHRTNRRTIARLGDAVKAGQESCEMVLNYRRDGSAFMNLLLIAPLYDNRGTVRYYLGAQIDISGLIEEGRGIESFERLLSESRGEKAGKENGSENQSIPKHLKALSDFGQLLSMDESNVFQNSSRPGSVFGDNNSGTQSNARSNTHRREPSMKKPPRRILGNDEDDAPPFDTSKSDPAQIPSSLSSGGRLPGVYQNYILVRPHPSLRVVFVSPALRIPGLLQSPFLDHIGGPEHVRQGIADAFEQGAAVTAKITWLPRGNPEDQDSVTPQANGDSRPSTRKGPTSATPSASGAAPMESRIRYISCTPLLGSDDQVGVWMVVMVENELVTGGLASRERAMARYKNANFPTGPGAGAGAGGADDDVVTLPTTTDDSDKELPGFAGSGGGAKRFEWPPGSPRAMAAIGTKKSEKGGVQGIDYASYLRKSTEAAAAKGKGKETFETGAGGYEEGAINGERRIEELISPVEEKGPVL